MFFSKHLCVRLRNNTMSTGVLGLAISLHGGGVNFQNIPNPQLIKKKLTQVFEEFKKNFGIAFRQLDLAMKFPTI